MILSRQNIELSPPPIDVPSKDYFNLPEKVLQFGTGVLLRGLPDYFIDKANKKNVFNGRIVVVKSTGKGRIEEFGQQDSMYTLCIKGIEKGIVINQKFLNASISRVLSASEDWDSILKFAKSTELEIVLSNTTEVGLTEVEGENIFAKPPISFPGKLLAVLYQRFVFFNGASDAGLVIIPTELLPENASILREILINLAKKNQMPEAFGRWITHHNYFCNSLVDRIVPGRLPEAERKLVEKDLGYEDHLMIMAEPYRLWAIESSNNSVLERLSFAQADQGVVISPNIHKFRELKLRLLNGSHTLNCGLAVLCGFITVKDAMADPVFIRFVKRLMFDEIAPVVAGTNISLDEAIQFGEAVLERFQNPFIEHHWLSIALHYTSKMRMRNIPILQKYPAKGKAVPPCIAFGFAGYIRFMKSRKHVENYIGNNGQIDFQINDDKAGILYEKWSCTQAEKVVPSVLGDEELWGTNLADLAGFSDNVTKSLLLIDSIGAKKALESLF
ncbi:MAG TPA: tagaturonate reductase [Puia sp.]|nr:tagaturonate reductase [Puia sp.]